jgi:hypothetical protein
MTARINITPTSMYLSKVGVPDMRRPMSRTAMMRAPIMVLPTVPEPPNIEAPPMTTAAIASRRRLAPASALPDTYMKAYTMPPSEARKEEMA